MEIMTGILAIIGVVALVAILGFAGFLGFQILKFNMLLGLGREIGEGIGMIINACKRPSKRR